MQVYYGLWEKAPSYDPLKLCIENSLSACSELLHFTFSIDINCLKPIHVIFTNFKEYKEIPCLTLLIFQLALFKPNTFAGLVGKVRFFFLQQGQRHEEGTGGGGNRPLKVLENEKKIMVFYVTKLFKLSLQSHFRRKYMLCKGFYHKFITFKKASAWRAFPTDPLNIRHSTGRCRFTMAYGKKHPLTIP